MPPQKPLPPIGSDVTGLIPNVGSDVTSLMGGQPPPAAKPQTRAAGFATFGDLVINAATGVAQGAAKTAVGLGQLVHKIPGVSAATDALYGMPAGSSQVSFGAAREELKPKNTAQAAGQFAEQAGEFFLPGGAVKKGVGAVTQAAARLGLKGKTAELLAKAGAEGISAAGVHSAQTGSTEGAGKVGMLGAGGALAAPAGAAAMKGIANRVESALVKASKADYANGFKVGNIFKYKLGGSLEQSVEKSEAKLSELTQQMRGELTRLGPNGKVPQVDVFGAIDAAAAELRKNAARNFGQNPAIERALDAMKSELKVLPQAKGGFADLLTANQIKQGVGDAGAWEYGKVDPDSKAKEIVANLVYRKLRESIEKAAPDGTRLREINSQIGDIIPIRQAIMRRIPVEQRSNVMNLGDLIGFGTGVWFMPIFNRALKSGQAANLLAQSADVTAKKALGTGAAAVGSQVIRK